MPKAKDELALVIGAAHFAAHEHKDQRRKDAKASPYINHPIALAEVLHTDGGVSDPVVIAAALLHNTIEDTETTYEELRGAFGVDVADVVVEVTDKKFLTKESRKRLQVAKAGRASERSGKAGEAGRQDLQPQGYLGESAGGMVAGAPVEILRLGEGGRGPGARGQPETRADVRSAVSPAARELRRQASSAIALGVRSAKQFRGHASTSRICGS